MFTSNVSKKVIAAAVVSLGLLLGTPQADAQAAVGVRGIAFCANGEEIWIDVGANFYDQFKAKNAFDDQVYSVCQCKGGLSFFTRNFYYPTPPTTMCPPYRGTPYWSY
ncbi:MAG: hypothetical protein D3904_14880 [Candidatus Electrothrix sp. EH2]|nr:hypothetical protein [Candidatus Electrothrix sp. EH2]